MRRLVLLEENPLRIARSASGQRPIQVSAEDEFEFVQAVAQYKRESGRQFPTCSELLEVLKAIGYAKRIWKPVDPGWVDAGP